MSLTVKTKTNRLWPKSRRLSTVTTLTARRKGSKPPGIIMGVRGGRKRSSYRRR